MPIDEQALARVADKVLAYRPRKIQMNLPVSQGSLFIERQVNGDMIPQRPRDGYINATALCKKAGKQFKHYNENASTKLFIDELSTVVGIPTSLLIQIVKGGSDPKAQGTWVHPDIAVNLGQWLSPKFAVQVSRWVREWLQGNVSGGQVPVHVQRYLRNRHKIPHDFFSMINEIYLNLLAPLEDRGFVIPDKMMPDISTGRMFSSFLRSKGINPGDFPTYEHEFIGGNRPTVYARLYPVKYLPDFRKYFNETWLPKQAEKYFKNFAKNNRNARQVLEYLPLITPLPPV